jgi:addiction module HigA family antidote
MENKVMHPIHPGEILVEEFLTPMGITQYRLAKDISVAPRRINEIVHGKRAISADTALRLARYFGTSERFWMNLQTRYDMEHQKDILGDRLQSEVVVLVEKWGITWFEHVVGADALGAIWFELSHFNESYGHE